MFNVAIHRQCQSNVQLTFCASTEKLFKQIVLSKIEIGNYFVREWGDAETETSKVQLLYENQ